MKEYRALDVVTKKLFNETLQKVQDSFDIKRKDASVGRSLLAKFDELKNYRALFVHNVTELKREAGAFIILLVEKHLTIIQQKRYARVEKDIEEIEPILIFSIPQNLGKAYIRPETFSDKITDLFTKVDIDFSEYPDFSKNYYVIGDQPDQVKKYLPHSLMAALDKIEGMTIEISGNWGLLRTEKNLTEDLLLLLISIGYKMTK